MPATDFQECKCVLCPLYVAYHTRAEGGRDAAAAFGLAARIVPMVMTRRRLHINGRDTEPVDHVRSVKMVNDQLVAVCADRVPGHDEIEPHQVWRIDMRKSDKSNFHPALPDGLTYARLAITGFSVTHGILNGAAQLTLMRALFVEAMRSIDHDLLTFGGQLEWHRSSWNFAVD